MPNQYYDPGSGALVFVPSPEQQEINLLKEKVRKLEELVLILCSVQGV